MRKILLVCALYCLSVSVFANQSYKLWYTQPAAVWEEALPLGNGRLGAMVYGDPASENIQLNENTFWAGGPHNNLNPAALKALPEIRRLITAGEYSAAEKLGEQAITSQGSNGMPYQTAGNLHLTFPGHKNYRHYYRDLNIANAVATTRYEVDGVIYEREIFTSFVDQVIAIKLTASKAGALTFSAHLSHPSPMAFSVGSDGATLMMQGLSKDHEGIKAVSYTHLTLPTTERV